ncbi:MAG: hypothetical protein ACRDH7_07490 [Actinomycetota bacterium]
MPDRPYHGSVEVAVAPPVALDTVIRWVSGFPEHSVTLTGNTIRIEHRYTPGWAILMGIVGLIFFLLGVLFFFVHTTDVLTVTATETPTGGTRISVAGNASRPIRHRLERLWTTIPPVMPTSLTA